MPHPTPTRPRRHRPAAPACLFLLTLLLAGPGNAPAQSVVGTPTDLQFTVRDATTGQPAMAERITLGYLSGRLSTVVDTRPGGASFTVSAVPVKDIGQYIVTLWYQGVPYWWQKRGADLTAGPVALDVFGVSENRDGVAISGLNVVVRHRETTADLELMVEIANEARPQVTVSRGSGTFELQLPAGATDLEATYRRGPEPTPVAVTLAGTSASLAMPLTPGRNQLRLTARVPWGEALDLPVGSDLPIAAWSLLTAPAAVTVEAADLSAPDDQAVPGIVRRTGPALAAGQVFTARLHAGTPAGEPETLFSTPGPEAGPAAGQAAAKKGAGGRGFALPLAGLFALIIIGALVFARRGRS